MPIYETTMTYAEMRKASEDGHVCAICDGPLSVAWDGSKGMYMLRCQNLLHNKITLHDKQYEERMKGMEMNSLVLQKMDEPGMLVRIEKAKFPQDLSQLEKKLLAMAAITYGFDPLMGEISIYQGRPYVSIDGRYRKAQETGLLKRVYAYPATEDERKAWQIPVGDYFVKAVVEKLPDFEFTGWGRVFASETTGKGFKPVEKNPQRMAEKRAEAQALRKAFYIPLPNAEDIGMPGAETPTISAVVADGAPETSKQDNDAGEPPKRQDFNFGAVLTWCNSHGKQFNRKWFLDNCGFTERDLDQPAKLEQAMLTVAEITGWEKIERG